MPTCGVTAAGFALKPYAQILSDVQADFLANVDPGLDLSSTSPEGQLCAIVANAYSQLWELAQTCYNASNRKAAEGAAQDAIGALIGTPRAGASYTQVYCSLGWTDTGTVHAPGSLVASVAGNPSFTFANVGSVTSNGATTAAVLFQAQTIGATPSVNAGTLTVISSPVSGWASVTNPLPQAVAGANAETDSAYVARQEAELGARGSCTAGSLAAALIALGASQTPPIGLNVSVIENTSDVPMSVGTLTLPPHSVAPIVYDPTATLTASQIAAVVQANKPAGTRTIGTTTVNVVDPILGSLPIQYTAPTPTPLYVSLTVVARSGVLFTALASAVQTALASAATAPTPSSGQPALGQFLPGTPVVGSQLQGVALNVPGVFDVQSVVFGLSPSAMSAVPISVSPTSVITIAAANVTVLQGTYP